MANKLMLMGISGSFNSWTPLDIPGCVLWLDATQIVGLIDGDPVGTWTDFSLNNHHATAEGDARPIYKTNIVNGLPVIRANGLNQMLTDHLGTNIGTIFTVMGNITANGYAGPLCFKTNAGGYGWHRAYFLAGDATHFYGGDANEIFTAPMIYYIDGLLTSTLPDTSYHVVTLLGDLLRAVPEEVSVMHSQINGAYIGDMMVILAYDTILSSINQELVQNYYLAKL
jgi:hypothetical protein